MSNEKIPADLYPAGLVLTKEGWRVHWVRRESKHDEPDGATNERRVDGGIADRGDEGAAMRLALIALFLVGCNTSAQENTAPQATVLSDGSTTCEVYRDAYGHTHERSGIPLARCFGIWLKENGSMDHYEEWWFQAPGQHYIPHDVRGQAEKHLLGRA